MLGEETSSATCTDLSAPWDPPGPAASDSASPGNAGGILAWTPAAVITATEGD
jgi:hypothetical protein